MITEEVIKIEEYIHKEWPKFKTQKEMNLNLLFPEPENKGLKHIWKYGAADLVVYRNTKVIAIIEPGGSHHFEEHQSLNDQRKFKLAETNNVKCLTMMNGVFSKLPKRKIRRLFGRYIFGTKGEKCQKLM